MAVRIKRPVDRNKEGGPRFDFGKGVDARDTSQTATIKELLEEISQELTDNSEYVYDIKSIRVVLRFLTSITGKSYKSTVEKHQISTIKTIKLLHKRSQCIDAHLMRLIEAAVGDSFGTMDFLTMPSSPEADAVKRQIQLIIDDLGKEIDPAELEQINAICDPQQLREKYRYETSEAIDGVLLKHIRIDDELLKDAAVYFAGRTRDFLKRLPPQQEPRAHVATYVYLKALDYVHRLHFELATQFSIPHDRPISKAPISFETICNEISSKMKMDIRKDTNIISIYGMCEFCTQHSNSLIDVIARATGLRYSARAFKEDLPRACMVMRLYLDHANLPSTEDSKPIGIAHIVSAFASILHQRATKAKVKLVKKSVRYNPKVDPQRHLDQRINDKSPYIPWTVQYLYTERMKWYIYALLSRKDIADSHATFQLAQSELTQNVFMSLSPTHIIDTLSAYRASMIQAAKEFVLANDRQDIRYEKIINY